MLSSRSTPFGQNPSLFGHQNRDLSPSAQAIQLYLGSRGLLNAMPGWARGNSSFSGVGSGEGNGPYRSVVGLP